MERRRPAGRSAGLWPACVPFGLAAGDPGIRDPQSAIHTSMDCRPLCGACCIGLSISSPIPGMPNGKPAGVRCVQLSDDLRCLIFGKPERPEVCTRLRPMEEMCGGSQEEALAYLKELERLTAPE